MGMDRPEATSTPTAVPILKSRRGIRDSNSVQSPIELSGELWNEYDNIQSRSNQHSPNRSAKRSPRAPSSPLLESITRKHVTHRQSPAFSGSENDRSENDSDESSRESHGTEEIKESEDSAKSENFQIGIPMGLAVLVLMFALYFARGDDLSAAGPEDLAERFRTIESEFSNQREDFWRSIRVNIKEVTEYNQPRSIIFLYENKARTTMDQILEKVSEEALCYLTKCSNKPITIEGPVLNTTEIVNDYGKIISLYRHKLEKCGVMIVRNLEKVPGVSAQAFHNFCDAYNPVVNKALVLFTLKVDKLPANPIPYAEKILSNIWNDIGKGDKFDPLFTRISDTVLSVEPEY